VYRDRAHKRILTIGGLGFLVFGFWFLFFVFCFLFLFFVFVFCFCFLFFVSNFPFGDQNLINWSLWLRIRMMVHEKIKRGSLWTARLPTSAFVSAALGAKNR